MACRNFLYLCFFILIAFNGCNCKDNEPKPSQIDNDAYTYFPNNNDKQWIFEVQKADYTLRPPVYKYVYDDTLFFEKDTNLRRDSVNKLIFKIYKFKKGHDLQKLIIGKFPVDPPILYQCIDGICCQLYDLDAIQDNGTYQAFKTDGKPINNRINAEYSSPFQQNYNSSVGSYKVINSSMSYNENSSNGYFIYKHTFKFGEKIGPIEYTFDLKHKYTPSGIDSFYTTYYKIKKVIY